jgi:hypothetical protein
VEAAVKLPPSNQGYRRSLGNMRQEYAVLIATACFIAWIISFLPCLVYLFTFKSNGDKTLEAAAGKIKSLNGKGA